MGLLGLLGDFELDEKATINNVRRFFEHDWPIIQNRAHVNFVDVKSPVISGMPSSRMTGNANDDKYSIHAQATQWVDDVIQACQGMPNLYRHILELRYFKNQSWVEVEAITGYSRKRGYELLNDALLSFAEAFSDTYDYREYK
jgi:ArpU family phage transcriptional regulator